MILLSLCPLRRRRTWSLELARDDLPPVLFPVAVVAAVDRSCSRFARARSYEEGSQCSIFVVFVRRSFFPFKEARFCDLIICTIEAAISRVRGECKRREGEKTENEILLFFNLKSRFGKEQEREYWECLNTSASAEGSQRDFFISNRRVLSLLLLYPFLFTKG